MAKIPKSGSTVFRRPHHREEEAEEEPEGVLQVTPQLDSGGTSTTVTVTHGYETRIGLSHAGDEGGYDKGSPEVKWSGQVSLRWQGASTRGSSRIEGKTNLDIDTRLCEYFK